MGECPVDERWVSRIPASRIPPMFRSPSRISSRNLGVHDSKAWVSRISGISNFRRLVGVQYLLVVVHVVEVQIFRV